MSLRLSRMASLVIALATSAGQAWAGGNDLALLNLCRPEVRAPGVLGAPLAECGWVKRSATDGTIDGRVVPDARGEADFRSLMSELGLVMAPRLQTPADTLGFGGFQVTAEIAWMQISNGKDHWNGVESVQPQAPKAPDGRPARWLSTVGVFARKGLWLPLPAFELGAGAVNLLDSRMFSFQGYAKLALHEGFHDWPIPSTSVRGAASRVVGTDQVTLTVASLDVTISKSVGVAGTARLEPYAGWNYLWIDARSEVIDATPTCDAYVANMTPAGGTLPSPACAAAQAGTWDDLDANFVFPRQSAITRNRLFGGVKVKFGKSALIAQYEVGLSGSSRDTKKTAGAKDGSATQHGFALTAGLDF